MTINKDINFQPGDRVRSLDFPGSPNGEDRCYIEGIVVVIGEPKPRDDSPEAQPPTVGWPVYTIRVERVQWDGEPRPEDQRIGHYVYPPVNGLKQSFSFDDRETHGVRLVEPKADWWFMHEGEPLPSGAHYTLKALDAAKDGLATAIDTLDREDIGGAATKMRNRLHGELQILQAATLRLRRSVRELRSPK